MRDGWGVTWCSTLVAWAVAASAHNVLAFLLTTGKVKAPMATGLACRGGLRVSRQAGLGTTCRSDLCGQPVIRRHLKVMLMMLSIP
ncbi:hypothetical protein F5Y01DRAFT_287108 [Xylaria sp. FL0043]|nr:hypothetical protein F5Y01DRAFT_287108 [Xylaria sp. FL0043]